MQNMRTDLCLTEIFPCHCACAIRNENSFKKLIFDFNFFFFKGRAALYFGTVTCASRPALFLFGLLLYSKHMKVKFSEQY